MGEFENTPHGATDLVVIGSSAGGVEALSVLVSTLPGDFPAPVVLAQHLDPSRPSSLDAILKRRTTLPVEVVNTSSALEPGKIYVVPSNRNVTINSHRVEVREDHNRRPHPSVDMLLSSAAGAFGDRLIAVILTGSGSDGAAGAVDVKNAGGMVIVQDPQTARYPSMPLALPPTVVDFEAAIDRIGPLLYDLLNGVSIPPSEAKTEDVQRSILEQVGRQASLDFGKYKSSTILRRIGRRMAVNHISTMQDYLEYLRTYPEEVGELVKAFLINVTQFFRDPNAFAYLKSEILPNMIAQARSRDRLLRFWTAGCASGEEPYSLAMLITDLLGTEIHEWSVKIFATDLDEAAINFARRGLYAENLVKGVPDEYRDRFFEHADHGFRISKTLRQMIIFGQQDLSRSAPFPHIDLVMCRNVLIYFTAELQEYVLNQFAFSLSPNGYLLLGKAETVRPNQSHFELVNKHWKVYRCTGNALPATRRPGSSDILFPRIEGPTSNRQNMAPGKHLIDHEPSPPPVELGQLRRFNESLLRFLPIGVVVIDRSYHVLSANGAARRLLGLRDISNEQDFLHAVLGIPYPEVRTAIDAVFREKDTVNLSEVDLAISMGGNGLFVALSIALMQVEAGAPDLAAISVTDVTEQVQTRRRLEAIPVEQTQLMSELSKANNEELETNNEELQATNEELETTNDELRARTSELQELATLLESERVRLAEMVELAPFYMLVLRGPRLLVEAFNPRFARLMEGRLVQGHSLDEVFEVFWESGMTIVHLAHEAYLRDSVRTTPRMMTHVLKDQSEFEENYFVYTIVPTHDANENVSGVIIYSVDETLQRAREADEELKKLRLIFDNTRTALALYDAQTAELLMGSPRYLDIIARSHGLEDSKLVGRKWHELIFTAGPEEAADLWNTALESREPIRRPEVHLRFAQNEQESIWEWSLAPILKLEQEDTVRFMLASAIEVTEQALARQEMEQLNLLKDDFLSLASHELRTPLSSILGNAQLLQRNLQRQMKMTGDSGNADGTAKSNVDQEVQMLERIVHQVRRMDKLIGEMMDITRMHAELFQLENKRHVNIVELVRRVVEQDTISTHHKLNIHTDAQELLVTCDEIRVEQVLSNMLSNAIKYSPKGTPVEVGVESRSDNEP